MSREWPRQPVPSVAAVVLRDGYVLLVKRGAPPFKGKWSLPGGAMKAGETAEEALRREVREETAVEVAPRTLIMVYDLIDRDADGRIRYHYAVLDFLADYVAGDPMPGSDVVHAAWLALRDLPEYDVTPGAMAILERALRYRRG